MIQFDEHIFSKVETNHQLEKSLLGAVQTETI